MTRASLDALETNFHKKHHQTYGHANPKEPVQLVTLRLTAVDPMGAPCRGDAAAASPHGRPERSPAANYVRIFSAVVSGPYARQSGGGGDSQTCGCSASRGR